MVQRHTAFASATVRSPTNPDDAPWASKLREHGMKNDPEYHKAMCHGSNILLLIERGLDQEMAGRVADRFRDKCEALSVAKFALTAALAELRKHDEDYHYQTSLTVKLMINAVLSPPLAAGETSGQVTDFSGGASDS